MYGYSYFLLTFVVSNIPREQNSMHCVEWQSDKISIYVGWGNVLQDNKYLSF